MKKCRFELLVPINPTISRNDWLASPTAVEKMRKGKSPDDPFDGKPLRYKPDQQSTYIVGLRLSDDNPHLGIYVDLTMNSHIENMYALKKKSSRP